MLRARSPSNVQYRKAEKTYISCVKRNNFTLDMIKLCDVWRSIGTVAESRNATQFKLCQDGAATPRIASQRCSATTVIVVLNVNAARACCHTLA